MPTETSGRELDRSAGLQRRRPTRGQKGCAFVDMPARSRRRRGATFVSRRRLYYRYGRAVDEPLDHAAAESRDEPFADVHQTGIKVGAHHVEVRVVVMLLPRE